MRPEGFYWVRGSFEPDLWIVARYIDGAWWLPGHPAYFRDNDLIEISYQIHKE